MRNKRTPRICFTTISRFNKCPEGVEVENLSPESLTETHITATYVTDSEEVTNSRKDTKDDCVTSSSTSQTKSNESSFKTSHWSELDCRRQENVPDVANDQNKCTTKRPKAGIDEKLTDDPAKHYESDPEVLLETSMKGDCYDKVIEARNLQAELAKIKQTNEELTARVERLFHDRQALEFQLEAQELKNNQLTKENAECLVHVTENRFLEETIKRLKEQLNEIAEQTDSSRLARRQLRAECVRVELERQRLVDEYLRLETSRASNQEQLEALNRRRQQLELFQEDIIQRQQLANRWQEVAGTIRIFVRIRSQTSKTEAPEKSTRFPYESGCLVVPAEDKIGIYLNRGQNVSICGAAATTTDNTVRLYNFNQIFPPATPQCKVYQGISNQVKRILDGYNVTVLYSGTSGSGKTFTCCGNTVEPGLASFSMADLLRLATEKGQTNVSFYASFIEIYNDRVRCLLSKRAVQIKDTGSTVFVKDQKEVRINRLGDFNILLNRVGCERKSYTIDRNQHNSRSHLFIFIKCILTNGEQESNIGTLIMGDLATPVRLKQSHPLVSDRLFKQESWHIQKSNILLSSMLHQLRKRGVVINCRGTRLTELLKPCFSGDSYLIILLNITDDPEQASTTQNVLEFGKAASETALGTPTNHLNLD
ncbi:kinesin-1 [Clonorchis sinensis]|uniref:Kinesin-1 n=1 Tax=Clonorchis sinensis TaxID=79923 RepID=H2KR88_CLOSI|nr:kinesin-1 [Clonorchis sinensis]